MNETWYFTDWDWDWQDEENSANNLGQRKYFQQRYRHLNKPGSKVNLGRDPVTLLPPLTFALADTCIHYLKFKALLVPK